MTDQTLTNPLGLEPYSGMAIVGAAAKINSIQGNIFERICEVDPALASDLASVQIGDTRYAVVRMDCVGHSHKPMPKNEGSLRIIPEFRVTDLALTDSGEAVEIINNQIDRMGALRAARDQHPDQGSFLENTQDDTN